MTTAQTATFTVSDNLTGDIAGVSVDTFGCVWAWTAGVNNGGDPMWIAVGYVDEEGAAEVVADLDVPVRDPLNWLR